MPILPPIANRRRVCAAKYYNSLKASRLAQKCCGARFSLPAERQLGRSLLVSGLAAEWGKRRVRVFFFASLRLCVNKEARRITVPEAP